MQPGRVVVRHNTVKGTYGTFRTSKGGGRVIIRYGPDQNTTPISEIADEVFSYASRTYNWTSTNYVTVNKDLINTDIGDGWGFCSTISDNGSKILVTGPGDYFLGYHGGAAFLYTLDQNGTLIHTLDLTIEHDMITHNNSLFGLDCKISQDGNNVLICGCDKPIGVSNQTSVAYLYNISQDGSVVNHVTDLSKIDGFSGKYGSVCALSRNGKHCVISGTGTDSTFYFTLNSAGEVTNEINLSQNIPHFGTHVQMSLDGKFVLVSGTNEMASLNSSEFMGNVYLYTIQNNIVTNTVNLSKTNTTGRYGDCISMSNDGRNFVVSGSNPSVSSLSDYASVNTLGGCGYYFKIDSIGNVLNEINVSDATLYFAFGQSCKIAGNGKSFYIGGSALTLNNNFKGGLKQFILNKDKNAIQSTSLMYPDEDNIMFGTNISVTTNGTLLCVSNKLANPTETSNVNMYVYSINPDDLSNIESALAYSQPAHADLANTSYMKSTNISGTGNRIVSSCSNWDTGTTDIPVEVCSLLRNRLNQRRMCPLILTPFVNTQPRVLY